MWLFKVMQVVFIFHRSSRPSLYFGGLWQSGSLFTGTPTSLQVHAANVAFSKRTMLSQLLQLHIFIGVTLVAQRPYNCKHTDWGDSLCSLQHVQKAWLHKLTDKFNSPSPRCHSSARHAFRAVCFQHCPSWRSALCPTFGGDFVSSTLRCDFLLFAVATTLNGGDEDTLGSVCLCHATGVQQLPFCIAWLVRGNKRIGG